MNVSEEEKVIDVEKLREAALVSVQSYAQTLPQLAAAGQDPSQVVRVLGELVDARKKGTPIEDAIEKAFQPPEPTDSPTLGQEDPMGAMVQENESGMPQGGGPLPEAQPQGMQQLLAGLTASGQPSMAARTMRQSQIA